MYDENISHTFRIYENNQYKVYSMKLIFHAVNIKNAWVLYKPS